MRCFYLVRLVVTYGSGGAAYFVERRGSNQNVANLGMTPAAGACRCVLTKDAFCHFGAKQYTRRGCSV